MQYTYNTYALPDKFEILINNRIIDTYYDNGKVFVEGRKGSAYKIKFTNNSGIRKNVVISVDGINVLTGDRNWEQGYLVSAYGSIIIPGWRKDSNNVAEFIFSSVDRSYNQRTDGHDVNNVGVIGCLVYNEKVKPQIVKEYHHHHNHYNWPNSWPNIWYSSPTYGGTIGASGIGFNGGAGGFSGASGGSAGITSSVTPYVSSIQCSTDHGKISHTNRVFEEIPQQNVGTGYGANASFKTVNVEFEHETVTSGEFTIYYDDMDGLRMRGIYVNRARYQKTPDPFPGRNTGVPRPVR